MGIDEENGYLQERGMHMNKGLRNDHGWGRAWTKARGMNTAIYQSRLPDGVLPTSQHHQN